MFHHVKPNRFLDSPEFFLTDRRAVFLLLHAHPWKIKFNEMKSPEPCNPWHFQEPPGLLPVLVVPSGARPCTAGGQILTAGPGHLQVAEQDRENKVLQEIRIPMGRHARNWFCSLV